MTNEDLCVTKLDCHRKEAYRQGYVAGEQAYAYGDNPYDEGTLNYAWWHAGHSASTDDLCGRGGARAMMQQEITALRAENERHNKDLADAAGELPIPVPMPGTDGAKLIRANALLRAERDAALAKLAILAAKDTT